MAVSGTCGKTEYRCLSWMRGGERCGSRQMPLVVLNVGATEGATEGVGRRARVGCVGCVMGAVVAGAVGAAVDGC